MAHITVVGSGIAGLIASIALARDGHQVTVHEATAHLGGRGRTTRRDGFHTNLGPHALYTNGRLHQTLQDLGIAVSGRAPAAGGIAWQAGQTHTLPLSPMGLLSTDLLGVADKVAAGRLFVHLPSPTTGETAQEWSHRVTQRPNVRTLLAALIRLVCYAPRLDRICMSVVHPVLVAATSTGVLYVDGGWQTLVDALAAKADALGVEIRTKSRMTSLTDLPGPAVLCVPPQAVRKLVPKWTWSGTPVKASVLDICLSSIPTPHRRFGLGWDSPRYLGLHSATAELAPSGGGLVHALGYMTSDEPVPRAELEALVDDLQPGWRDVVHHARYLPAVTVSHDHPHSKRASHQVREDVWVAGDWVGTAGVLADCAAESALHSASAVTNALMATV